MDLSREDAAQALADIAASEARSSTLAGYRRASPYLVLWGCVWGLGYGAQAVDPTANPLLWPILSTAGGLASFAISRRTTQASDAEWRVRGRRTAGMILSLLLFTVAVMNVFAPVSPRQVGAFFPLLVSLAYMLIGIWGGARMLLAGVALGALTLLGFFALGPWFYAWMAVVGGGALIGFGVWLERV